MTSEQEEVPVECLVKIKVFHRVWASEKPFLRTVSPGRHFLCRAVRDARLYMGYF